MNLLSIPVVKVLAAVSAKRPSPPRSARTPRPEDSAAVRKTPDDSLLEQLLGQLRPVMDQKELEALLDGEALRRKVCWHRDATGKLWRVYSLQLTLPTGRVVERLMEFCYPSGRRYGDMRGGHGPGFSCTGKGRRLAVGVWPRR